MQLHFIINSNAGNGRGIKRWEQFKQDLTLPYTVHWTQYAGHTLLIVKEITERATKQNPVCLIAVGGDGTVHEVLNGVVHFEHVYIGVIAAGSGNDFARGYETFKTGKQLEHFIKYPTRSLHDYGSALFNGTSKYFINNFGVGFDAFVAMKANESKLKKSLNRWKLGKLSYPYYVISALFTYKPFHLTIILDGKEQKFENVWFATVSNQPYFGGGMKLSPASDTCDGTLEVTVVSNLSKWKLLFVFGSVFFAKHTGMREVHQFSTHSLKLLFEEPIMAHADGEKQKLQQHMNTIEISVHQKAWSLAK